MYVTIISSHEERMDPAMTWDLEILKGAHLNFHLQEWKASEKS